MFKINCDQQDIPCTVIDAYIAECKFPPKPGETNSRGELVTCYYDVVLQLQDARVKGPPHDPVHPLSYRT